MLLNNIPQNYWLMGGQHPHRGLLGTGVPTTFHFQPAPHPQPPAPGLPTTASLQTNPAIESLVKLKEDNTDTSEGGNPSEETTNFGALGPTGHVDADRPSRGFTTDIAERYFVGLPDAITGMISQISGIGDPGKGVQNVPDLLSAITGGGGDPGVAGAQAEMEEQLEAAIEDQAAYGGFPGNPGDVSDASEDGTEGFGAGGDEGLGYYKGGHVNKLKADYRHGGPVQGLIGRDPKGPDDGMGYLDRGEFVINKRAARLLGPDFLNRLNQVGR